MERATAPGLDQGLNQSAASVARLGGTLDGFRSEQGMCEIIMSRARITTLGTVLQIRTVCRFCPAFSSDFGSKCTLFSAQNETTANVSV